MRYKLLVFILLLGGFITAQDDITPIEQIPDDPGTAVTISGTVTAYFGNNRYSIADDTGEITVDGGILSHHTPLALSLDDEVTLTGRVDTPTEIDLYDLPEDIETEITAERAEEIALEVYRNATSLDIDLDLYGDVPAWEVELDNGLVVYVDAATGVRLAIEPYRTEADTTGFIPRTGVEYSQSQVQQIANALYPDATISETTSTFEKGIRLYQITLDNDMVVIINAANGSIVDLLPLEDSPFDTEFDTAYWLDETFSVGLPTALTTPTPVTPLPPPDNGGGQQQPPPPPPPNNGGGEVQPPQPPAAPTLPPPPPPPATTEEAKSDL